MFTLCVLHSRRCGKLLLRSGASHEASPNPYDPQPVAQLWPLQKDGDLCTSLMHPKPSFLSLSLCFWVIHSTCVLQRPHKASAEEMTKYHSDDYIKFLRSIRPDNMSEYSKQMQRCKCGSLVQVIGCWDLNTLWACCCCVFAVNVGEDCPVFDGLFEFCQLSGGGSVGKINRLFKNF